MTIVDTTLAGQWVILGAALVLAVFVVMAAIFNRGGRS